MHIFQKKILTSFMYDRNIVFDTLKKIIRHWSGLQPSAFSKRVIIIPSAATGK